MQGFTVDLPCGGSACALVEPGVNGGQGKAEIKSPITITLVVDPDDPATELVINLLDAKTRLMQAAIEGAM